MPHFVRLCSKCLCVILKWDCSGFSSGTNTKKRLTKIFYQVFFYRHFLVRGVQKKKWLLHEALKIYVIWLMHQRKNIRWLPSFRFAVASNTQPALNALMSLCVACCLLAIAAIIVFVVWCVFFSLFTLASQLFGRMRTSEPIIMRCRKEFTGTQKLWLRKVYFMLVLYLNGFEMF